MRRTDDDDDWLTYVFERMRAGTENELQVSDNAVTFVTFNFDYVIQEHLLAALADAYDGATEDFRRRFPRFPRVIHVHGRVPTVPSRPLVDETVLPVKPVMPRISLEWIDWLSKAAREIVNVATDSIDEDVIEAAQTAIRDAKPVCFLGFSYDQRNLAKLGVPQTIKTDTYQHVFGSAFRLEEGEQAIAKRLIAPSQPDWVRFGDKSLRCCGVLRSLPVFIDPSL